MIERGTSRGCVWVEIQVKEIQAKITRFVLRLTDLYRRDPSPTLDPGLKFRTRGSNPLVVWLLLSFAEPSGSSPISAHSMLTLDAKYTTMWSTTLLLIQHTFFEFIRIWVIHTDKNSTKLPHFGPKISNKEMSGSKQKRILLWATPRTLSTAFCRAMVSRDSCKVHVCVRVCMRVSAIRINLM